LNPRAPARAAWDGYFFIAIFPSGEWCKIHLFTGGPKHCVSALEGLDGGGQELALIGRVAAVERRGSSIERVTERRGRDVSFEPARVVAKGIEAQVEAKDRFYWIRVPRLLTYFTETGRTRVTIDGMTREGLGLVEHAWGASTRVDVARLAPRRWHWDVLSLGGSRFFAGLAFGALGVGAHGAARLEEELPLSRVNRLRIRVRDWSAQGERRVPQRWAGTMVTRSGALRYEARAATPASPEGDGGGCLGFTWEGELRHAPCAGAGFC
jgi:hypothetical protein